MLEAAIIKMNRRPRFRRADETPSFQLTERDVEIVRQVARHRFLRSTHISQFLGAPHKKICERLALLYHARYLDRPRSQIEYHARSGGSDPYAYALGNEGARILREREDFDHASIDWARKNSDSARHFLLHTLAVAEFRVALAAASRARRDIRIIWPEDLLQSAPEHAQQYGATRAQGIHKSRFAWRVFRVLTERHPYETRFLRSALAKRGRQIDKPDLGPQMPMHKNIFGPSGTTSKLSAYPVPKVSGTIRPIA